MDQSSGAACLDGTAPGYYFEPGTGDGASKWLIYFMGGGLCIGETMDETLEDCYTRSSSSMGSSLFMPPIIPGMGIFDGDAANNPSFHSWNRVVIWYCDGTLHQGYLSTPIIRNGKLLYFRGD
jgi:O-palmitoleoyl-L-serine hydrolase